MYYELAAFSVLIAAGYWGSYFVRRESTRMYGVMQLVAAALAGFGLLSRKAEMPKIFGVAGAIGLGAGVCLVVVGPLVRAFARRMALSERFTLADAMLSVAEVLAPGSGAGDEKALVAAMRQIRDGNIEPTVEALSSAKRRAPAQARVVIDERIAMLYLAAYRWDEAIAHAEATLIATDSTADHWQTLTEGEPLGDDPVGLRHALGIAPPVWVELLGAYGYTGDLDRAAQMLARLEDVCARRDDAAIWVHRGRMMFLALAGRVAAVQALLDPRKSRHMSRAARAYWTAVAHERKGDAQAATAAYIKAKSQSRGRPRVLIDQALERMPHIRSIDLPPSASQLIARVEASPLPAIEAQMRPRGAWATRGLIAALIIVWAVMAWRFGATNDLEVASHSGAMVPQLVYGGQWWRTVSYVFVHVGGLHLVVNAIGVWIFGRLSGEMFGSSRMIAIFAVAGVGGAISQLLASPVDLAAGASGATLGLLGAALFETMAHRQHRSTPTHGFWVSVGVVAVGQLGLDSIAGMTNQWVHVGGMAAGLAMGFLMSPLAKWAKWSLWLARAIATGFAAVCVVAAIHLTVG